MVSIRFLDENKALICYKTSLSMLDFAPARGQ
jgi:hypothetical protein